jgi:hypothetical protein
MIYIFYGNEYYLAYNQALGFFAVENKKKFFINKNTCNYSNKDDLLDIFQSLVVMCSHNNDNIFFIESVETMLPSAVHALQAIIDNFADDQIVVFITDKIHLINDFIASRAFLHYVESPDNRYEKFSIAFYANKNFFDIELLLETYSINADNSVEAMIFFENYIGKEFLEFRLLRKYYVRFIPNMYIQYWQFIFFIIRKDSF